MKRLLIVARIGRRVLIVGIVGLVFLGCEAASPQRKMLEDQEGMEGLVVIVIDRSGSMDEESERAFQLSLHIVQEMAGKRAGNNDRLVIAQISGQWERALLWAGGCVEFKRSFTARSFNDFLNKHTNPNGSPVYRGFASAVEYAVSMHQRDPQLQSCCFLLSDCLDNDPEAREQEARLDKALKEYRKFSPAIAAYWVDSTVRCRWENRFREAGFQKFIVEDKIVRHPTLPRFEN